MADGAFSGHVTGEADLDAQIKRSRATFPNCRLHHEIEFSELDWAGIAALAATCAAAELPLVSLRCRRNGGAICVVADNDRTDMRAVSAEIAGQGRFARWTVHLAFGADRAAPAGAY